VDLKKKYLISIRELQKFLLKHKGNATEYSSHKIKSIGGVTSLSAVLLRDIRDCREEDFMKFWNNYYRIVALLDYIGIDIESKTSYNKDDFEWATEYVNILYTLKYKRSAKRNKINDIDVNIMEIVDLRNAICEYVTHDEANFDNVKDIMLDDAQDISVKFDNVIDLVHKKFAK